MGSCTYSAVSDVSAENISAERVLISFPCKYLCKTRVNMSTTIVKKRC